MSTSNNNIATLQKVTTKRKDYGRVTTATRYNCEETGQSYYRGLLKAKKSLRQKGFTSFTMRSPIVSKMNY